MDQFIASLTECGLMTRQELEQFLDSLPADQRPRDGKELARVLYAHHQLTRFQVQTVYQGKTRRLVLGNYVVLDRLGKGSSPPPRTNVGVLVPAPRTFASCNAARTWCF